MYRRTPCISFHGAQAIKRVERALTKLLAALVVSQHGRGTHVYSYGWLDTVDNAQKSERTLLAVLPRMGPKGPIFLPINTLVFERYKTSRCNEGVSSISGNQSSRSPGCQSPLYSHRFLHKRKKNFIFFPDFCKISQSR